MTSALLDLSPEVANALQAQRPVVALESTLIAHGLPWPLNHETAAEAEAAVRAEGAVPATVAVWEGTPTVGLSPSRQQALARGEGVLKASRRDLAFAVARKRTAATTVAATMYLAHRAGIRVFATGGIGGVHRGAERSFDESADLEAIARHPVCVVCAGAKLVLDLALTLERLETLGVPVVGYGTSELPAFYVRSSGLPLPHRVDDALAAARVAREQLARGVGIVIAVPIATNDALDRREAEAEVARALASAERQGIRGAALTPFVLGQLSEATGGRSLAANLSLLRGNARVAAQIALALAM